jgi:peptidoglycan endopeptidase LytE
LANVNSLGPSSSIRVGQRLTIPTSAAGGSTSGYYNVQPTPEPRSKGVVCSNPYLVQPGDTLTVIAVRCGVTTANLRQWNGLRSDAIWTGQMLITRGPSYGSNPTPLAVRTPVVVMPYVSGPRATPTPRIEPTISPW